MKSVLKRIISDYHARQLPAFKPRTLEVPLDSGKIITIIGPRRAGKTCYFSQLISRLEIAGVTRQQILYINFEDERLNFEGNYDQILGAYFELYPHQAPAGIHIFFDEIQELHNWEKFVRRLYDTVTKKIYLTGSNAKMLSREIATSLRGRSLSFEIMPLSFREFLLFKDIDATDYFSTKNSALINNCFDEYLVWGGFPELVNMESHLKPAVLQEYFNVMLYRDLAERYNIRDHSVLKYLIKRLIGSYTKEFSINKIYNDLKSRGFAIGKDSIYRMMDQIFSIYMLTYLEKYDPSVVKREMSNRKIYLYDNGFASATHYSFPEDRGKLFENAVFAHLRTLTEELFFLKSTWECDFLAFPKGEKPILIQVTEKFNSNNIDREITGLLKARKWIDNAQGLFLVADMTNAPTDLPDWINVMELPKWLLSSGGQS